MSNIVSPYKNIKQHTKIKLEPYHMNSDIRNHMKLVLKKKVEKKCNKNGFIDEVFKILEFSDGILIPENLDGSAIYNIAYHCRICIPIENTTIIVTIKMVNPDLIVAINGPMLIFIPKNNVDTIIWDIPENYNHRKTNKKLVIGNFVKIQITNKRINQGDSQIKIMGNLQDFATNEEVEQYYGSKIIKTETQTQEENVEQNETNFIV
jgi:DNA-directed RNA polymerase subunit E'/Rpb7